MPHLSQRNLKPSFCPGDFAKQWAECISIGVIHAQNGQGLSCITASLSSASGAIAARLIAAAKNARRNLKAGAFGSAVGGASQGGYIPVISPVSANVTLLR